MASDSTEIIEDTIEYLRQVLFTIKMRSNAAREDRKETAECMRLFQKLPSQTQRAVLQHVLNGRNEVNDNG